MQYCENELNIIWGINNYFVTYDLYKFINNNHNYVNISFITKNIKVLIIKNYINNIINEISINYNYVVYKLIYFYNIFYKYILPV